VWRRVLAAAVLVVAGCSSGGDGDDESGGTDARSGEADFADIETTAGDLLDLGTTDLTALATTERPRPTRNLLTGEPGPTIAADTLDVELPGYGSALLEIQPPP
jgi:hypothetical protein